MIVYLLHLGEYSDRYCYGVFRTEKAAKLEGARMLGAAPEKMEWKTFDPRSIGRSERLAAGERRGVGAAITKRGKNTAGGTKRGARYGGCDIEIHKVQG